MSNELEKVWIDEVRNKQENNKFDYGSLLNEVEELKARIIHMRYDIEKDKSYTIDRVIDSCNAMGGLFKQIKDKSVRLAELWSESVTKKAQEDMIKKKWFGFDYNTLESVLPEREAKILKMRYDINGNIKCALEEVGRYFEVGRERISQLQARAIFKLWQKRWEKK